MRSGASPASVAAAGSRRASSVVGRPAPVSAASSSSSPQAARASRPRAGETRRACGARSWVPPVGRGVDHARRQGPGPSCEPRLSSGLVRHAGRQATWLAPTEAHSCGTAPESHRLRCRPADARRTYVLLGHAGGVERRHLAQDAGCGLEHGQRQAGPAALAEAQAEVEQRVEPEGVEHRGRARLGRAVAGDAAVDDAGHEPLGGEQGGVGDDAVDDDGHAGGRTADDEAGERGDLEPADGGEGVERPGRDRLGVAVEDGVDDRRPCGRGPRRRRRCPGRSPPRPDDRGARR